MNSEQFCYWLKGYFDISETSELTLKQAEEVKKQFRLVMEKDSHQVQVHLFKEEAPAQPSQTTRNPLFIGGVFNDGVLRSNSGGVGGVGGVGSVFGTGGGAITYYNSSGTPNSGVLPSISGISPNDIVGT